MQYLEFRERKPIACQHASIMVILMYRIASAQLEGIKPEDSKRNTNSPLAPHGNNRIRIPLIIHLLLHLTTEANRTHDPIPKLLIEHRLVRIPVVLHDLVQPIDQRFHGGHGPGAAAVREAQQLRAQLGLGDAQDVGELGDVLGPRARLAVEERGHEDLAAPERRGDGLEGQGPRGLGVEEGFGGEREAGDEGGLLVVMGVSRRRLEGEGEGERRGIAMYVHTSSTATSGE